jgi:hypothetical protein
MEKNCRGPSHELTSSFANEEGLRILFSNLKTPLFGMK